MARRFIRTCQSCGNEQLAKDPATYQDKAGKEPWRDVKCRKCHQDTLDYGSYRGYDCEPWRAKFKELTGHEPVMTDNELEELIDQYGDEGLFKDNELYTKMVERSKANAESIEGARISYGGY